MARQNRLYSIGTGRGKKTTQAARNWLRAVLDGPREDVRRGRLQLESLERRALMAGDVDLFATDGVDPTTQVSAAEVATPMFTTSTQPEGEAAQDLVAFAELLDQVGVKFYGADWCPACREQKELFGDGKDNLPFIEVTNPDRTPNQVAIDNNVTQYPTWEFPSGQRLIGVQTLQTLATAAGVAIPVSDTPTFEPIGDQTVGIGSPLHVVIDAYDPGEGAVTTTVTVADPSLVQASVVQGNRSIRIDVENFGVMVFELFEGQAPRTTAQIIQLVQNGFYDQKSNGDEIIFHRVIDNFVLQAGDPLGTGVGGSSLPDVDDEFHPDLQHNREGILSFAKAGDDTNNSQFFITEGPTRTLDYNHSVLGQLVEGFDVREAISRTATNASDRPIVPVVIRSVEVFQDNENSLVLLKPMSGQTGTTTATFTVTDADGNTSSETVTINVVADNGSASNSQPYLGDIATPAATPNNTSAQLQLTSIDIEGDPVRYLATNATTTANVGVTVDPNTGLVTVTPPAGFVGTASVLTGVEWVTPGFGGSQRDTQLVEFEFTDSTAAGQTLVFETKPNAFVGNAYTNDVNVTGNNAGLTFTLVNPPAGATINASTGQITYTPTAAQIGNVAIGVTASRAGTVLDTGTFNVAVSEATAGYRVVLTNIDGSAVSTLTPGTEFFATLVLDDQRDSFNQFGAFSASVDLLFDPAIVAPVAGTTIQFLAPLNDLNGGTIGNGIIDNVKGISPSTQGTQVAENPFARIRFRAVTGGTATFQTASAADSEDTLLIGVNDRINPSQIAYNATTVTISGNLSLAADTFTVAEDSGPTTLDVLANDTSNVAGTISVTSVTQPASGGTVTLTNGQVSFTPTADFNGTVNFSYTATVGSSSSTANVTVNVTAVNDPPVAIDQMFSVGANQGTTTLDLIGALNSTDPAETDPLIISAVGTPTGGGTVTISADNRSVNYTPPTGGTSGTDTFTYTLSDGEFTDTATVTINLDAVPTAVADAFTLNEDTSGLFDVLVNDTADTDGQTFTIVSVGAASNGGTATVAENGTRISYTPAPNFNGSETVTYTIRDTGGGQATATITFNVTPVNDAPPTGTFDRTAFRLSDANSEQTVLRIEDLPANVDAGESVLFGTATIGNAATGTVRISSTGTEIIFVPAAATNSTINDTITFTTVDGDGLTSTGTIALTVNDYLRRSVLISYANSPLGSALTLGQALRIEGTDINGDAVSRSATTTGGGPMFDNLLPGNYEVVVPAVPFLQGGEVEQRIPVSSGVDDGDATVQPNLGLLKPEFLSVQDFLGSTSRRSVLVAVQPGQDSLLSLASGNVTNIDDVRASLDTAGGQLTIQGRDPAATAATTPPLSATVPTAGDSRVQVRGQIGDMQLYRINLDPTAVTFTGGTTDTPASTTPATTGTGTGSSAAGTSLAGSGAGTDTPGTSSMDSIVNSIATGEGVNASVNDAAITDSF